MPLLEIKFIDMQRQKNCAIGQMMISATVDNIEQKKQEKTLGRKQVEARRSGELQNKVERENVELAGRLEDWEQGTSQDEIEEQCPEVEKIFFCFLNGLFYLSFQPLG